MTLEEVCPFMGLADRGVCPLIGLVCRRSSPVLVEEGLDYLTIGKAGGQVEILSFKDVHFVVQVKERLHSSTRFYVTLCMPVFLRKLPMTTQSLLRLNKRITGSFRVSHFLNHVNPYPTAFPYGNGMVLHFYQQQESSTTKTVHRVINRDLKLMYSRLTVVRISINL